MKSSDTHSYTTRFDLDGNPYDISAECIRSRADMAGAAVFVVEGRIGNLRVLDFSEREAELTYRDEAEAVEPRCHCGYPLDGEMECENCDLTITKKD